MNRESHDLDSILDRALEEIREEKLDSESELAASERVWARVSAEAETLAEKPEVRRQIRDCTDFQALIPAYLRDGLAHAKSLLLEDHLGECVPCRRALRQARTALRGGGRATPIAVRRNRWRTLGWRIAAAAAVFIALIGLSVQTDLLTIEAGGMIRIEEVEGDVFKVTDEGALPVADGEQVTFEDVNRIRTGKGSGAMLRLADDSLVEMSERAELSVKDRRYRWERGRGDAVVNLARGTVIVEASDQGSGHLYVDTDDCRVAVTGTVFAVNHGVKGSRVSVIEGEVHVAYASKEDEDILLPGEQSTSRRELGGVPVEEEIAWSRNLERHLALLQEFSRVAREIDREIEGPGVRFSTELLDRAPEGTVIYVGIPNVSTTIHRAYDLMQQKIASNDLLQEWWTESMAGTDAEAELQRVMNRIQAYGEQFGEELAVTLQIDDGGEVQEPLVMTRLLDPPAFRELLTADLAELKSAGDSEDQICIVDDDSPRGVGGTGCAASSQLYIWIGKEYLAVAPGNDGLQRIAGTLRQEGGRSAFAASEFHDRLAELYRDGVEWVVALDLERLIDQGAKNSERPSLERLGLLDLQHAIVERKQVGDRTENRAMLTFDQPRRGLAAWLAEPAPMGSLDFVSPDAYLAGAFVMKEPASVVDELFEYLAAEDPDFELSLSEFEAEHSLDVRQDIAAALGGEFAFALDGPVLPKPSWKLIVEVYDPARLQTTLDWAVTQLDRLLQDEGRQGFRAAERESDGRIFHEIESLDTGISVHYMFVDGYMVAAASRALLERSLQLRDSGNTLTRSADFTHRVPRDGQVNFSAVVYQNLGPVLAPLSRLGENTTNVSPQAQELVRGLGSMTEPNLIVAYGQPDRIVLVNSSEGGALSAGLARFLSLQSLMDVQQLVGQASVGETRVPVEPDDSGAQRNPDTAS